MVKNDFGVWGIAFRDHRSNCRAPDSKQLVASWRALAGLGAAELRGKRRE